MNQLCAPTLMHVLAVWWYYCICSDVTLVMIINACPGSRILAWDPRSGNRVPGIRDPGPRDSGTQDLGTKLIIFGVQDQTDYYDPSPPNKKTRNANTLSG